MKLFEFYIEIVNCSFQVRVDIPDRNIKKQPIGFKKEDDDG